MMNNETSSSLSLSLCLLWCCLVLQQWLSQAVAEMDKGIGMIKG